ncbi:MAG TPA: N-acetylmuramoyl-L-alanine amidase [Thermoanaerobaculia bacterium]|nr:N-acetylmuramoyl-L-alanine amidase [Thermoanaerobaculia bacterium]
MRAGNIERVKRRMLQEAVAENLDVIRGLPPRALRPSSRFVRIWLKRAPFLVALLTLLGSSYLIANGGSGTVVNPLPVQRAAVIGSRQAGLPVPREAVMSPERMTASAFPLTVKRVVLDAGHGGNDPGATAPNIFEKEITLDIGRRLRALLESDGFDVVVTRDADRTIALKDRAHLANASKSDIFVSIHVNALVKHTASRGIETYYLGTTSDPKLTALAAAENRVSGYSVSDMRRLLEGVYADARRDESHELAMAVQRNLFTKLRVEDPGLENWGVKRAPFIVLVATDMPAVLAEVGCISNDKESAMLRRPEYRQKIADALFEGIRSYASANVTRADAPQKKGIEKNG